MSAKKKGPERSTPPSLLPDSEVITYGHVQAMYRSWLRQELFYVRMYADAHLWPEPDGLTHEDRERAIAAIAVFSYLMRIVRVGRVQPRLEKLMDAEAKHGAGSPEALAAEVELRSS